MATPIVLGHYQRAAASDVVWDFFTEKGKECIKAVNYALKALVELQTHFSLPVSSPPLAIPLLTGAKNLLNFVAVPGKTKALIESFYGKKTFFALPSAVEKTWWDVVQKAGDLATDLGDSVDVLQYMTTASAVNTYVARALPFFKVSGTLGTFVNAGIGTWKDVRVLQDAQVTGNLRYLNQLRLGRDFSYLYVGAIGLVALKVTFTFTSALILIGLISGFAFTVQEYFFARTQNPENNPEYLNKKTLAAAYVQYVEDIKAGHVQGRALGV